MKLIEDLLAGDERALARAISLVEERSDEAKAILQEIFPRTGKARVIGITGFPGSGKSSLVDRLTAHYRSCGNTVGVIAVDPSSAYSGGAILGDRIRMQRHTSDEGVYIRSMATRGALGGLSKSASDAIDVLDASGRDVILLETVGVGQDEVDVVRVASCVLVVLVPGLGDDIQAIKAGILEIADIFVINKADRPGADRLQSDLESMLSMNPGGTLGGQSAPTIVRTVAIHDEGTEKLAMMIERREHADPESAAERRKQQCAARFVDLLQDRLLERAQSHFLPDGVFERLVEEIASRRTDPYSAVESIIDRIRFN
jgi:LAO/AO transport system kinase